MPIGCEMSRRRQHKHPLFIVYCLLLRRLYTKGQHDVKKISEIFKSDSLSRCYRIAGKEHHERDEPISFLKNKGNVRHAAHTSNSVMVPAWLKKKRSPSSCARKALALGPVQWDTPMRWTARRLISSRVSRTLRSEAPNR
jgi:hypothetical protein